MQLAPKVVYYCCVTHCYDLRIPVILRSKRFQQKRITMSPKASFRLTPRCLKHLTTNWTLLFFFTIVFEEEKKSIPIAMTNKYEDLVGRLYLSVHGSYLPRAAFLRFIHVRSTGAPDATLSFSWL